MSDPSPHSVPVGLVGLGLVGSALAGRLRAAGFDVVGCDIDGARREPFAAGGGTWVANAVDVFARCPRVILSLPSHVEVNAVVATLRDTWHPGTIVIDTTTGDPANAETLAAALGRRGVHYLDATISGSSTQIAAGSAVLLVGGDAGAIAACTDLLGIMGREVFATGASGTGAKMKLVTNLVLGLNRAALAEGLAFAAGLGLDPALTLAAMRGSPAYSRIMDTKGEKMIRQNFTPEARLSQHFKDVRIIVATGKACGLPMPLSVAHAAILAEAEAAGWGQLDNSALIKVLGPGAAPAAGDRA